MSLDNKVAESLDLFAYTLFLYLRLEYLRKYDEDMADLLAVAVSNELLSRPPGNEKGAEFLSSNRTMVESHVRELSSERDLCAAISEACRMIALLKVSATGQEDPKEIADHYREVMKPEVRLCDNGLYVENPIPPRFFGIRRRMKEFVKATKDFYNTVALHYPEL